MTKFIFKNTGAGHQGIYEKHQRSKQHSEAAGKQPKHEEMKRAPWDPGLRNLSCGALREDYTPYYVIRRSDLEMEDCVLGRLNFIKFT